MAPLLIFDIIIGEEQNTVGIFGCTLSSSQSTESLLSRSQRLADAVKVTLQLVDAKRIAGHLHLLFATNHALQAFHHGTQRAKTVGMEILRYTAAQRQIARALELFGVTRSTTQLGGVLLGDSQGTLLSIYTQLLSEIGAQDTPQVLEISTRTKAEEIQCAFNISDVEIGAVSTSKDTLSQFQVIAKLVYERCALLSIEK